MTSKPPEAPAPVSVPLSDPAPPKIPSIPVLSVGSPSRPPPGTSAALAAGVFPSEPAPRITTPSSPSISTPPGAPTSDPPPVRSDPPGTGRRLAPPPKPRRESVPASGEGTPSVPPVASPAPPVVVLAAPASAPAGAPSTPPPAVTGATTAPPVPSAPAAALGTPAPAAAIAGVSPAPPPVRPPAPSISDASATVTPMATPSVPPARLPSPSTSDASTSSPPARPLPSLSGPPPSPSSGSVPPRPPRRLTSMEPGANPIGPLAQSLPPNLALEAGGLARVTPHHRPPLPLPRPSEPPPPAHVIVAGDSTLAAQHKPTPAPAINVMRIIAVGAPGAPPAALHDADLVEDAEDLEGDELTPMVAPVETDAPEVTSEHAELDDLELAPDSQETKAHTAKAPDAPEAETPSAPNADAVELGRDDALSVPPEAPAVLAKALPTDGEAPASDVKAPPPPPRRPSPPRRSDSARPRARRALKRPWWEDLFGEDFTRAVPRLSDKQVSREVDFIEESLGVAKGGVVLDLGCGAGHHAVDLASRGYGVVGYDLSVYQLALAADVAQEREQKINFLHGDMREMAFEAMFDGIYCWNTSFGYFEEEKNLAVAERIFRALKPGGMFLIDVANRDFAATYSPSSLWYEGDSCVCMDDMNVDFITSRLRVKRSVIFDDGRARECLYSIRLYSLHELGKLLHEVGFRVAEASGHPSTPGVFFGELSPRLIVLAQKP
jgi:SAM-dependent methyltransferase